MKCNFCESLDGWRKANSMSADELNHEIAVAILIRTWRKGSSKRHTSRITDYRYRGCGYKLNYCPECGRAVQP